MTNPSGPLLSGTGDVTLSNILSTIFFDKITNNIQRSTPLPQLIPVLPATAQTITWVANLSAAAYTNGAAADGATVSYYNTDLKLQASLSYCTYFDAVAVGGRAQTLAQIAGNPNELIDLIGSEIKFASQRLAVKIATAFYTGTGASNQLQGLYSTTGTTYGGIMASGTYAGIDRSSYTEWSGNALTNGGVARALTVDLMRDMRRTIYSASGMKPDLIVCDPFTHEQYAKTFGSQRFYKQDVSVRGQKIVLDGGFGVLDFDGVPVIEDVNHPTGKMTFLNTNEVEIRYAPPVSNPLNNYISSVALVGTPEEQYGAGPLKLSAHIKALAANGDVTPLELLCYLQLVVKRPNACGYIGDLLTS